MVTHLFSLRRWIVIAFLSTTLTIAPLYCQGEMPSLNANGLSLEAEDGDFFSARFDDSIPGYQGEGAVCIDDQENACVSFDVNCAKGGLYRLILRYALPDAPPGPHHVMVSLDDKDIYILKLPSVAGYAVIACPSALSLSQGECRILLSTLRGQWLLDAVSLIPWRPESSMEEDKKRELANPKASLAAQSLYAYLQDLGGKGILSGQQLSDNMVELRVLERETGKSPAILGFDFMDYSPSRVERGARSRATEQAIDWWRKRHGIVSFCWHWNAPAQLVDKAPDRLWWSGFYTKATSFDVAKALSAPDGKDYALLLRDIDAIALQLKRLEDAGVPVLWRPLHEASGAWFWWGSKGPTAYIKLYRLLYERLCVHHGLTNLLWVWNGQDPAWYPGDDCVDIVSRDIYADPGDYSSQKRAYLEDLATAAPGMPIALSEVGVIPDPDNLMRDGAHWVWFCVWSGGFIVKPGEPRLSGAYSSVEHIRRVYSHPYVINLDGLPRRLFGP